MVALFTRAWIEISEINCPWVKNIVALFTRAWIEISEINCPWVKNIVALFTRAWIEISKAHYQRVQSTRRPLHEGVD